MATFWTVLIRRMLALGHEVVCAAPDGDATANAALTSLGVRLCHYPLDRKGLNPLRDAQSLLSLYRLIRRERPDVLFATTIKPVIYGCLAARMAGIAHINATITGLGYAFEADNQFKRMVNRLGVWLYRLALRHAEGVFFQNRDDLATFRQSGILGPDARVLLARGTGVDTARFAPAPLPPLPPEGPVTFLLVGRLLEAKGLAEYAAAAKMLHASHPHTRFLLLGPQEQGLGSVPLAQVRQWERECGIEYLGETRDVRPHVARAHVLVLPSWREGTPTAVMEAMSMGRACVVTDVPGCRDVVSHHVNGLLTPPRDPQALARAMQTLADDPQAIARMGAAGRQMALDELDATRVADRILEDMRIAGASAPQGTRP